MTDEHHHPTAAGADLPPANTERWVKSRKMAVIEAIRQGRLTEEAACERYNLSPEELGSWKRLLKRHGPDALRTTHLKRYRKAEVGDPIYQSLQDDKRGHPPHNNA